MPNFEPWPDDLTLKQRVRLIVDKLRRKLPHVFARLQQMRRPIITAALMIFITGGIEFFFRDCGGGGGGGTGLGFPDFTALDSMPFDAGFDTLKSFTFVQPEMRKDIGFPPAAQTRTGEARALHFRWLTE